MKAPVAARLRILDIIFHLDQTDIVLLQQTFRQKINVFRKRTHNAHTRNIIDICLDRLQCQWDILATHFLDNTVKSLHSCLDRFNRISVVFQRKLFIEHLELRLDLHDRTSVICHQAVQRLGILLHKIQKLIGHQAIAHKVGHRLFYIIIHISVYLSHGLLPLYLLLCNLCQSLYLKNFLSHKDFSASSSAIVIIVILYTTGCENGMNKA